MRKTILLIGMTFLALTTFGQNQYLSFQNGLMSKENQKTLPSRKTAISNDRGLKIEFNFNGAFVSETKVENTSYNYLDIEGMYKMGKVGSPALPAKNDIIAIPKGAKTSIKIINADYKEYSGFYIHPALKPARDTEGASAPKFEKDEKVYSKNAFFPSEIVEVVNIAKNRETGLAYTEIHPIQFNPTTKTIRVYTHIEFEIIFEGGAKSFDYIANENTIHFTNLLKRRVLNSDMIPNGLSNDQEVKDGDAKNYIIITHSEYSEQAEALANWKRQLGYSVEVVAQNSWTAAEVKAAISTRYQNWIPKPDYFVIIGDHTGSYAVPAEIHTESGGEEFATDLYFACMDGASDWHPDIARGRISVSSAAEATVVVNKIINYEQNPPTTSSYYENGLNCAQFQDKVDDGDTPDGIAARRFCHTSEEIRDYMTAQQGYTVDRVYYTDPANTPTNYNDDYYSNGQAIPTELLRSSGFDWDGDQTDITNSINAGKFYVFHRDHGYVGGSGWAHPYYTTSTMSSLSNGDKLPVVFSMNCHTGEFQLSNCFAEKFIRMENKGAVGVVAAAYYSYSGFNDAMSVGMIDAIWSDPGLYPVMGSAGSGSNYTIGVGNNIYTMGDVVYQGLYAMEQNFSWSSGRQYTYELFHYFGDPAMKIWTSNPNDNIITATHAAEIDCASTSFSISGSTAGATATLVFNNELIGETTLDGAGAGNIPYTILEPGSEVTLTISSHNHKPYTSALTLTGSCDFPPEITTNAASLITENTATLNGEVIDNNGATVTESGFVYSTTTDPVIGGAGVIKVTTNPTTTTGTFSKEILGLPASTTYFVKAYAINANGTGYGAISNFTTLCGVISNFPLSIDFSTELPTCWENMDNGTSGQVWEFNNPGGRTFESTTYGNGFAILDSDNYGNGNSQDADLISPTFDFSNYTNIILEFEHYFKSYSSSAATISFSTNNGGTWTEIESWTGTSEGTETAPSVFLQDLSTELEEQATVRFKWNYTGSYGYYWAIDDIEVNATLAEPQYTVIFNVTDASDNHAIDGASIIINSTTISTNSSGVATIDLSDGSYPYTVSKDGYDNVTGIVTVSGAETTENVSLSLAEYTLTFVVKDEDNQILQGASIGVNSTTLTTNESGEATIDLVNGTHLYTINEAGYNNYMGAILMNGSAITEYVTLTFPVNNVTFNVTDAGDSHAIDGASIAINSTTISTNSSGEATIDLRDGSYPYTVNKTGYDEQTGTITVAGAVATENVSLSLTEYTLTFVVKDEANQAVDGASIDINSITLTTNGSGEATINLVNGTYGYTVSKVGFDDVTSSVTIANGNKTENVTLTLPAYTVTFNVTDAEDNHAIDGASITINSTTISTNSSGIATIDLSDGSYPYTVNKTGYDEQTGTITVAGAVATENVSLSLTEYTLTFVVKDEANQAVDGASIDINSITLTTNGSGEATIDLVNGEYSYAVSKAGFDDVTSSVTIANGNKTENVTLTLSLYTITFNVSDAGENHAIDGASITINSTSISTNSSGVATIDLSNGSYPYTVNKTGYDEQTGSVVVSGAAVTENVTVTAIEPIVFETETTDNTCFESIDGSITINNVTGGVEDGYMYSIDEGINFQTSNTFESLAPNTYNVVVKDEAGNLSETVQITISEPEEVIAVIDYINVTVFGANDGVIEISATGGDATYEYSMDNGATWQQANMFTDLAPAEYLIVVRDGNFCLSTMESISITEPAQILYAVTFTAESSSASIENLSIHITDDADTDVTIVTDVAGSAVTDLPSGDYVFETHLEGYENYASSFTIIDEDLSIDLSITGINDKITNEGIVYPNPTTGLLNIDVIDAQHVEIIDLSGKTLLNQPLSTKKQIDLVNIENGVYLIKIQTTTTTIIQQIVVKK